MKKLEKRMAMFMAFVMSLCVWSCGDDPEPSTLSVSTSNISVTADGETQTISVTSNTNWTVTGGASWLSLSPSTGSGNASAVLTISENKDFAPRNCSLTFSTVDGEASQTVTVNQEALDLDFSVNVSEVKFSAKDGEERTLQISTNGNWSISGGASWLDVKPTSGSGNATVTLTVEGNEEFEDRKCSLTISANDGKASASVSVKQEAQEVNLSVDVYELNFSEKEGDVQNLRITSNADWKIAGIPEWLDLSSTSGSGSTTIKLTSNSFNNSSSSRSAVLLVEANGVSKEVKVFQKAGLVSDCDAVFGMVAVLSESLAFDLELGSNVASFGWGWMPKSEAGLLSDDEVIKILGSENFKTFTPEKDGNRLFGGDQSLSPNTEYVIYSLAYDKNGKRGNLLRKEIKTKKKTNAPFVSIKNVEPKETEWKWTTVENASCDKYYHVAWTGNDLANELPLYNYSNAGIAWRILVAINNNELELELNGDNWTMKRNKGDNYLQIVTWGVSDSGELSGILNNYRRKLSSASTQADIDKQSDCKVVDMRKDVLLNNVKVFKVR